MVRWIAATSIVAAFVLGSAPGCSNSDEPATRDAPSISRVAIKPERDYNPEAPFYSATGGAAIYGDFEGRTIIGVSNFEFDPAMYGLYRLDMATREVLWELHGGTYGPMSLHPDGDRFLVYKFAKAEGESWGIAERWVSDSSLIRELSDTTLGPIGHEGMTWGSQAVYDPHEPDKIWIADPENHVIIRTDWEGNVDRQFGEYGVAGSDDNHLDRPTSISLIKGSYAYTHAIAADWNNHRIFHLNSLDMHMEFQLPFPYPQVAYIGGATNIAYYSGIAAQNPYGVFIVPDHAYARPMWHYPSPVDSVVGHPSQPYRAIVSWGENQINELDLSSPYMWQSGTPKVAVLFTDRPAASSTPIYSPPIVDWFNTNKNILIVPSQSGKMELEVARFGQKSGDFENLGIWSGQWDKIAEVSLSAGVATSYSMTEPFSIGRIKITLDVDGTVDGWINLAP